MLKSESLFKECELGLSDKMCAHVMKSLPGQECSDENVLPTNYKNGIYSQLPIQWDFVLEIVNHNNMVRITHVRSYKWIFKRSLPKNCEQNLSMFARVSSEAKIREHGNIISCTCKFRLNDIAKSGSKRNTFVKNWTCLLLRDEYSLYFKYT